MSRQLTQSRYLRRVFNLGSIRGLKQLSSNQIRKEFQQYFNQYGFQIESSASLIPHGDKSLLFTNAGMVPLKGYFLQPETTSIKRLTTIQKCVRAGGKHNDLEQVGSTPRHHTFFEMLGFFSFGDLSKSEAINLAWRFLTETLELDQERLSVSVYKKDEESFSIWKDKIGLPNEKIQCKGDHDNFWSMGDEGPCGPCTEIFWDTHQGKNEDERLLEIWNIVFMQYNRHLTGKLEPLPNLCIDTGMGLERLASVLQKKQSNFETDVFQSTFQVLDSLIPNKSEHHNIYHHIIADHIRSSTFLISDGITPSNIGRGYVLRRIIRRAVRAGEQLGLHEPFLYKLVPAVVKTYQDTYQELHTRSNIVADVLLEEERIFRKTLGKGNKLLDQVFSNVTLQQQRVVPGDVAFQLHATHGFPLDLTMQIARERGWTVDQAGFEQYQEQHRATGSASKSKFSAKESTSELDGVQVDFVGYDPQSLSIDAKIVAIAESSSSNATTVCIHPCPFYGLGGGQVADHGRLIRTNGQVWHVIDVIKSDQGTLALKVRPDQPHNEPLQMNEIVQAHVDRERRLGCQVHHTATHLLNAALKHVLCKDVMQAGSFVGPDRLRFDFTHGTALTKEQIKQVEDFVNDACLRNISLVIQEKSLKEALASGTVATFSEKYGERVRVVEIPTISAELCGGTHVHSTLEVYPFRILSDTSVAAGTRRIEAVAGIAGSRLLMEHSHLASKVSAALGCTTTNLVKHVDQLLQEQERQRQLIRQLQSQLAQSMQDTIQLDANAQDGKLTLQIHILPDDFPRDAISKRMAWYQQTTPRSAHLLLIKDHLTLLVDTTCNLHAGQLLRQLLTRVGGKGGGREESAQGRWTQAPSDPQTAANTLMTACCEILNATHTS